MKQMPTLVSIVERYKAKSVALYAVNKQESVLDVKKFVQKTGWTVSVLLDSDGAVGELYGVRGIPHAFVIDRNGVVRASHLGFVPELREKLTEELDTIVGKNKE